MKRSCLRLSQARVAAWGSTSTGRGMCRLRQGGGNTLTRSPSPQELSALPEKVHRSSFQSFMFRGNRRPGKRDVDGADPFSYVGTVTNHRGEKRNRS